jgi:integrase
MLTETKLKSLRPKDRPYRVADGQGLSLEINPGGAMTWVYRFRLNGRQAPVRLGRYPVIGLAEARGKRLDAARLVEKGKSPAVEKRTLRAALSARMTVEDFSKVYVEDIVKRDCKDSIQQDRYFRREIVPAIGGRALEDIAPHDILAITDRMKRRGVPISALAVRNLLKRMFDYAIARQLLSYNPASAITAKSIASPKSRTRTLTPDEIKTFVTKLYQSNVARRYKLVLHLLLITMVRKSELILARWSEVDDEGALWTIPAANTKMGRPRIVPLSSRAAALFRELRDLSEKDAEFVLPGRNAQGQPADKSVLNAVLRGIDFEIEHFTIHDFRRTASTLLHEIGWHSDVIEKALGHEIGGVRGIYNRAEYAPQRQKMLQQWADYVDSLVTEQKVIVANFRKDVA